MSGKTNEGMVTKRQVAQMIRQAFERRQNGQMEKVGSPPILEELGDGQEVEIDLFPGQIGPGEPIVHERRRYVRSGDRLFFYVLKEVK